VERRGRAAMSAAADGVHASRAPLHRPPYLPPAISSTAATLALTLAIPGGFFPNPTAADVGGEEEGKEVG
jgi:hypothetical protein